jgi:hypothetical protein
MGQAQSRADLLPLAELPGPISRQIHVYCNGVWTVAGRFEAEFRLADPVSAA